MIDDVKFNIITARDVLKDTYELYEASSAKEGFEILDKIIPDLILLDIVMPEMDGYEMIVKLKEKKIELASVRFMGHVYLDHRYEGYLLRGFKVYVAPITWKRVAFNFIV